MAAYDMDPKPEPGEEVLVTYRAVWSHWNNRDGVRCPLTRSINDPSAPRFFVAPDYADVEIVKERKEPSAEQVSHLDDLIDILQEMRVRHGNVPVFTDVLGVIRSVGSVTVEHSDDSETLVPVSVLIS